jgi:malate dehydrogenase (oxaloacetate-decarboxylating)(NADP+)
MTLLAAEELRRFGVKPKVALLSHSNFGSSTADSAGRMRHALNLIVEREPDLEVDGEMQGDAALSEEIRQRIFPNSRLRGQANLLIMPTLDAANICFSVMRSLGEGLSVGPMLLGLALPAHISTPSVSVRGIVNLTAVAAVDAQMQTQVMI